MPKIDSTSTVKPRLSEQLCSQNSVLCLISEFVQITEVVAKISRNRLVQELSPSNYC